MKSPPLVISGAHLLNPYVGVGVYTLRLIRGLARAKQIDFKVLLPEEAVLAAGLLPREICVQVKGRAPANSILKNLYWTEKLSSLAIRHYSESIFHSPGPFWSLRRPKKLVVTLHDCIYRRFPLYMGRLFIRKWLAFASERYASHAQLVLTDSDCSAQDLQSLAKIDAAKIKVLYPSLDPDFNPDFAREEASRVRAKYHLPEHYVLYVGGYDYRKNVEFLIKAYAAAKTQFSVPPLVLAGGIPKEPAPTMCDVHGAMQQAGLIVGKDVFTPGFVVDADMPGLYGGCEMLVYPSLYEGFGYPPAEAIACGKVALVADNSSLREVVPQPKNRFASDQVPALATLISQANQTPSDFLCAPDSRFTETFAVGSYLQALKAAFPSDFPAGQ